MVRDEDQPSKKHKIVNLKDYAELTRVSEYGVFTTFTAIYNRISVPRNLSYLYCGVVEEFCEFKAALKLLNNAKVENISEGEEEYTQNDLNILKGKEEAARLDVLKELGDITWYLTAMCNELEIELESMVSLRFTETSEEGETLKVRLVKLNSADLQEILDQVLTHIGTIGGKVKKSIRDDNETITDEKKMVIECSIREMFRVISVEICPLFNSTMREVMRLNAAKAASRFARGVVQGDGDNR